MRFVAIAPGVLALGLISCATLARRATPEPRPTLPLATLPATTNPRDLADFYPTELASAERGEAVYRRLCVECHGEEGQGDGPRSGQLGIHPTNLANSVTRDQVPPAWYFRVITNGAIGTAMLGWESQLIEQQRWDVTFYAWSLATSPTSVIAGEELYGRECAACHGARGLGDGPQAGTLARPPTPLADPRYLAGRSGDELKAAIAGDATAGDHDWSDELTKNELESIITYLWTFLYD